MSMEYSLIDSHCHLQLVELQEAEVMINRAKNGGIVAICVCGTSPADWKRVEHLYMEHKPFILPQYGLHPWWIQECLELGTKWESELRDMISQNPLAGVGECGLDKVKKKQTPMECQSDILESHFAIASEFQRTITLHCVGAWGILLNLIKSQEARDLRINNRGIKFYVLHACNSLPLTLVKEYLAIPKVRFSFTKVTAPGTKERNLLNYPIPLFRLLVETDSPDQTPNFDMACCLRKALTSTCGPCYFALKPSSSSMPSSTVASDVGDADGCNCGVDAVSVVRVGEKIPPCVPSNDTHSITPASPPPTTSSSAIPSTIELLDNSEPLYNKSNDSCSEVRSKHIPKHRPRDNEPLNVFRNLEDIAYVLNLSVESLAVITTDNAKAVFG